LLAWAAVPKKAQKTLASILVAPHRRESRYGGYSATLVRRIQTRHGSDGRAAPSRPPNTTARSPLFLLRLAEVPTPYRRFVGRPAARVFVDDPERWRRKQSVKRTRNEP
jgi:hypothetical protein